MSGPKRSRRSKCRRKHSNTKKMCSSGGDATETVASENCVPSSETNHQEPSKLRSIISKKNIKEKDSSVVIGLQMKVRRKTLSVKQKDPISSMKKVKKRTLSWVDVCSKNKNFSPFVNCNTSSKKNKNKPVSLKVCSENIPLDDLELFKTPCRQTLDMSGASKMSLFNVSKKTSDVPMKSRCNLNSDMSTPLCSLYGLIQKPKSQVKKQSSGGTERVVPGKGTLKRKRWIASELEKRNLGHEDDIYEYAKFQIFEEFFQHDDSELSGSISTPKLEFILSPKKQKKTPVYRDCFSPSELRIYRKVALQHQYQRTKGKVFSNAHENTILQSNEKVPERKKLNFSDIISKIAEMKKRRFETSVDKENSYLSQASNL